MDSTHDMPRREFLKTTGVVTAGSLLSGSLGSVWAQAQPRKKRLALVGTGIRGTSLWGKTLLDRYADTAEFVGLCDINPGRVAYGKTYIKTDCPTFTSFEEMVDKTRPDAVIVTTVDATHHHFIIKAMEMGCDVITEKPLTTDEVKCRQILDTERRTGKKVTVTFNYRYGPHMTRIKELLADKRVGDTVSVDFHWYLNTDHGASYFRRWHGLRDKSGTLLVHKASHHFDLLNWWLDADPEEVYAYGALEHYGKNHAFRGDKCRGCAHWDQCPFHWDITKDQRAMDLYVAHEQHDGYIRDACLWRPEIDIYDKMAVQIRYANNVYVSYSLTTYCPYEGWRIAFNGTRGRIDSWEGIPWQSKEVIAQEDLHALEMSQDAPEKQGSFDEIMVMDNFGDYHRMQVPRVSSGHGGGDVRMQDEIFKEPGAPDPLKHAAGTRDGAMSILIGIAARRSIEEKRPVKIAELTDIKPLARRPV